MTIHHTTLDTMPASLSAEEIKFLPMTPELATSKDPMAAAGASTLKAEKEGPAVDGVEGVKEVSAVVFGTCSFKLKYPPRRRVVALFVTDNGDFGIGTAWYA